MLVVVVVVVTQCRLVVVVVEKNSSKMLDTKNTDSWILVHTNFRRVGPDFI